MKNNYIISLFLLLNFVSGCNITGVGKKATKENCILSFEYFKHDAVGPESLVSVIQIQNSDLKVVLLKNSRLLVYKYTGGIYNIDSLYFPKPLVEIYNHKDSTFIFDQSVFRLRQYPELFIDSIMELTQKEITIEIIDTLTNKNWTIPVCK